MKKYARNHFNSKGDSGEEIQKKNVLFDYYYNEFQKVALIIPNNNKPNT